jgi:hypothetical protein
MSDLIDLDESPLERDSDQTDPITNPRVVVA